jgi:hypothetical protein
MIEDEYSTYDGQFLSPVVILKGTNKKQTFVYDFLLESEAYMNLKSSDTNSVVFLKLFREAIILRKPSWKRLLILDGHASHCDESELLEQADSHDVAIFCLPSHTTQAPQLLDWSSFRPFKTYYNREPILWMRNHKERNITRYLVTEITGRALYHTETQELK